ncbi:hypothetical protein B0H13DRAFT_2334472 [Mycena leptocephala]|nr:hypothetical protein B0H13DRAFT_2334472 [Mycena leptocephala]
MDFEDMFSSCTLNHLLKSQEASSLCPQIPRDICSAHRLPLAYVRLLTPPPLSFLAHHDVVRAPTLALIIASLAGLADLDLSSTPKMIQTIAKIGADKREHARGAGLDLWVVCLAGTGRSMTQREMQYLQIRLFPAPTLDGGAFFSLLRFVLHTQAWSPIDRSLVFVQGRLAIFLFLAPFQRLVRVCATSSSSASASASSSAPPQHAVTGTRLSAAAPPTKNSIPFTSSPRNINANSVSPSGKFNSVEPLPRTAPPTTRASISIPPLAATSAPVLRCVELFNFKFEFDLTFECEFGQQEGDKEGMVSVPGPGFDSDFDMGGGRRRVISDSTASFVSSSASFASHPTNINNNTPAPSFGVTRALPRVYSTSNSTSARLRIHLAHGAGISLCTYTPPSLVGIYMHSSCVYTHRYYAHADDPTHSTTPRMGALPTRSAGDTAGDGWMDG